MSTLCALGKTPLVVTASTDSTLRLFTLADVQVSSIACAMIAVLRYSSRIIVNLFERKMLQRHEYAPKVPVPLLLLPR